MVFLKRYRKKYAKIIFAVSLIIALSFYILGRIFAIPDVYFLIPVMLVSLVLLFDAIVMIYTKDGYFGRSRRHIVGTQARVAAIISALVLIVLIIFILGATFLEW